MATKQQKYNNNEKSEFCIPTECKFSFCNTSWVQLESSPSDVSDNDTMDTNNIKQKTCPFMTFTENALNCNTAIKKEDQRKLQFDWTTSNIDDIKVDLHPPYFIKWRTVKSNESDEDQEYETVTNDVLEQMTGQQDPGDSQDKNIFNVQCKIYELNQNGEYVEKGNGNVKVNIYNDGKNARILCRRNVVKTILINARIFKQNKFEKIGKFLRFSLIQLQQNEKYEIKTFLLKPKHKINVDTLLKKIEQVQNTLRE